MTRSANCFRHDVQIAGLIGVADQRRQDLIAQVEQRAQLGTRGLGGDVAAVGGLNPYAGRTGGIGGRWVLRLVERVAERKLLILQQERSLAIEHQAHGAVGLECGVHIHQGGEFVQGGMHAGAQAAIVLIALHGDMVVALDFANELVHLVHRLADLLLGVAVPGRRPYCEACWKAWARSVARCTTVCRAA